MNIEEFRDFCLSLPDTYEKMRFSGFFKNADSILVFYVGTKMFCFFDINKFDKCTLKCNPDEIEQLKANYQAVEDPFNLSKKYWVGICFNEDMPDDKIKAYVKQSYDLVASSQKNKLVK